MNDTASPDSVSVEVAAWTDGKARQDDLPKETARLEALIDDGSLSAAERDQARRELARLKASVETEGKGDTDASSAERLPYAETCPEGWRSTRKLCIFAFVLSITGQWASCLALPAIYNRLAESLGFTPAQLGLLHSMRLFSMFGTLPLHAFASQFADRGKLMGGSLILGGVLTIMQILGTSYGSFMFINILSGASLGMVVPVTRSLIPNYYRLEDRGGAFGILEVAGGIGGFFGAALGVMVTTYTQPFGYAREIYDDTIAMANAATNASGQVTWDMWVTDQLAFSNATAVVAANFQGESATSLCCVPWQTNFIILGVVTIVLGIMVTVLVYDPVRNSGIQAALGKDITKVFEGLRLIQKRPFE